LSVLSARVIKPYRLDAENPCALEKEFNKGILACSLYAFKIENPTIHKKRCWYLIEKCANAEKWTAKYQQIFYT
tara:strand:- start:671 stop:892 length:222 start_codon:yes stop_codon:yes gene_type:complete